MHYDYEQFTPDRFQEFCQSLIVREYSGAQCYPVGQKDGGRDAFLPSGPEGTVVFQIKFRRDRLRGEDIFATMKLAIDGEIPKVERLAARGATKYIIATNLVGTSALDVGSMDKVQEYLDLNLPLPGQVWWRRDLDARLNNAYDLKWVYSEIITGPDMLRMLIEEGLGENSRRRMLAISGYLRSQYDSDEFVKFKQADLQASDLLSLFVDVPVTAPKIKETSLEQNLIREVREDIVRSEGGVTHGVRRASRSFEVGGATLLLHPAAQANLQRIVIEGAPGQGKSTLAQYICQVQRMRILGKNEKLAKVPPEHRLVPSKVPFKVDLRDLSGWLRGENPFTGSDTPQDTILSLETFLAAQVTHLSGGQIFSVSDLALFFSRIPAIIFLDGLDEVATMSDRKVVVDAVSVAANRLNTTSPGTQIIVTSRPAAVANAATFNPSSWSYFSLEAITEKLIYEYTDRWSAARNISTSDIEEIKRILRTKLDSAHIKDLARNAMQLTILLNLVHIRGQALPDHRTELYDKYMDVFFNREADKDKTVMEHRQLLIDIHGYLAWRIHSAAESRRANGRISEEVLKDLIRDYLASRGHSPDVLDDLLSGVLQRIVALVSRVEGTFEFEVQPLREYFAARHLYDTAPYSPSGRPKQGTKPEIFAALALNPYWLNVTRFYAGCYSVGELAGLADQMEELLSSSDFSLTSAPRSLATCLLADRVFHQAPKVTKRVARACLDPLTFRFTLSRLFSGMGNSVEMGLPADCGMDQAATMLVERCLNLPSRAARQESAQVSTMHHPDALRSELWLAKQPSLAGPTADTEHWLEAGVRLRVVRSLGRDVARQVAALSETCWLLLVRGGHPSVVEAANDQRKAVDLAASGTLALDQAAGAIGHLGGALIPRRFILLLQPEGFFEEHQSHSSKPELVVSEWTTLAGTIDEFLFTNRPRLSETIDAWVEVIALYEAVLGQTWMSWSLAHICVRSLRGALGLRGIGDIDSGDSLAFALQAKARKTDWKWWHAQAGQAAGDSVLRRAWLLHVLSYATPSCLRRNLDLVNEFIETLSSDEYGSLLEQLRWGVSSFVNIPANEFLGILQNVQSGRLSVCLTTRCTGKMVQRVADSLVESDIDRDQAVADIALRWLLVSAGGSRDLPDWDSILPDIRRIYRAARDPYSGFLLLDGRRHSMSESTASAILDNCDAYPMGLITTADITLSTARQRKLVPVARIARTEKWAAN